VPLMTIVVMIAACVKMLCTGHGCMMLAAFRRNMRTMMMRLADATFHRDGRERLSRKAQCKQNDDEEFAPVVHGAGV